MPNLYKTKLVPTSITATSAQTGYDSNNLFLESIAREWRATSLAQNDIDFNYSGAGQTVQVLHVHDCNFASASVYKSVSGGAYALVGTLTTYLDKNGRRRGFIVINSALVTGVRLRILTGATTDGLSYWRVGSAYVFAAVIVLPPYEWGYDPRWIEPGEYTSLVNGQRAAGVTAKPYHLITVRVQPRGTEDWSAILAALKTGTCLLDCGLSSPVERRHHVWPVTKETVDMSNPQSSPAGDEFTIVFREVTGG